MAKLFEGNIAVKYYDHGLGNMFLNMNKNKQTNKISKHSDSKWQQENSEFTSSMDHTKLHLLIKYVFLKK